MNASMDENEARLARYLLGRMSENEQLAVESEYFRNREAFEHLLALEDELMYDYLRGDLSAEDRAAFQNRFAEFCSAEFPQALIRYTDARGGWRGRIGAWSLYAIAAGLVIAGLTTLPRGQKTPRLPAAAPSSPVIATFVLEPGLQRGADQIRRITPPAKADRIRFELRPRPGEAVYSEYRGVLRNGNGEQLWAGAIRGRIAEIPARVLVPDEYRLELEGGEPGSGFENAADYSFKVVR
jgi:hypothetical protein